MYINRRFTWMGPAFMAVMAIEIVLQWLLGDDATPPAFIFISSHRYW